MAAFPTERSWRVLEFERGNSVVAVRRGSRRQFGRYGRPVPTIRMWYEQCSSRLDLDLNFLGLRTKLSCTLSTVSSVTLGFPARTFP
jgi:hypothetical protein